MKGPSRSPPIADALWNTQIADTRTGFVGRSKSEIAVRGVGQDDVHQNPHRPLIAGPDLRAGAGETAWREGSDGEHGLAIAEAALRHPPVEGI